MSETSALVNGVWNWLVIASITAAVAMPVAWLGCRFFKVRSAAARYQIWFYVLLAVVIAPLMWLFSPKIAIPVLPVGDSSSSTVILAKSVSAVDPPNGARPSIANASPSGETATPASSASPKRSISWPHWVVGLWLLGMVFMLIRLTVAEIKLRRVLRRSRVIEEDQARLSASLGRARLMLSDEIEGPLCCGLATPVVVLPRSLFETEDDRGLRMIMAHEVAHIRRKDYLANLFQRLVEAVFFFHPAVWFASRELSREREVICDQYVIGEGNAATAYVKLLSSMVEQGWGAPSGEAVALFEGNLLMRVRTLLDSRETYPPVLSRRTHLLSAATASVLLLAFGTLRLEARHAIVEQEQTTGATASQESEETELVRPSMRTLHRGLIEYQRRQGRFPERLDQLTGELPKDPYHPTGGTFSYEAGRHHYVLGSCGPDKIFGNEDDLILYFTFDRSYQGPHFGPRTEVYPLPTIDSTKQLKMTIGENPPPKGNCSLSGNVVSAADGKPISHASVFLHNLDTHAPAFIRVGEDGSFEFKDIAPGVYALRAGRAAGYQDLKYNPEARQRGLPKFTLDEGEHLSDILFELEPAYSISGRVSGELPEVVPGQGEFLHIFAWAKRTEGSLGFEIAKQQRVQADGSFFLDGLDERPVYVMFVHTGREQSDGGYCPQYYPGTFSRDEARQIVFGDEVQVENVDFEIIQNGGVILQGHVSDEYGKPVRDAFVVVHRSDMGFDNITAYTNEEGYYEIPCLSTGDFLVHVDAVQHQLVRTRSELNIAGSSEPVILDFTLNQGVRISGRFIDERGNPWEVPESSYGYVILKNMAKSNVSYSAPFSQHRTQGGARSSVFFKPGEGDYSSAAMVFPTKSTFVVEGVMAGTTSLMFEPKTEGQVVKQILHGDQDITESDLFTKPGEEISDITIVISGESVSGGAAR